MTNIILATDSYKLTHFNQYPKYTEKVYSYLESREGAQYPYTVFFGLQSILINYLVGTVVTKADIAEAEILARAHFGCDLFNRAGWEHILDVHDGKLPLIIKAVPEGTPIPTGNVMMTVENTCKQCWWLTNAVESLLTHVWYPSTVATQSRAIKEHIALALERTGTPLDGLPFMLHDFGYRGATSHESAAIGGAGHLVNFKGTDTLPAMQLAMADYDATLDDLAFSVPATEHSVMTALGRDGEHEQIKRALETNPTGVLSVVGDSYDIYEFVKAVGNEFKDQILARDGVFVVRPDSKTRNHPNPPTLVEWILYKLWEDYGGTENDKGIRTLDPHVRVLWGDGIDGHDIEHILNRAILAKFSPANLVFGMGGGLLQKVNRDTQRFAFKSSAQMRTGMWFDIWKEPLDATKKSKRGRLSLIRSLSGADYKTIPIDQIYAAKFEPVLEDVFVDGDLMRRQNFEDVRANAELR